MAGDTGLSFWPTEHQFPAMHYGKIEGNHLLEKPKQNYHWEEKIEAEEPVKLDDVFMLDDIREFAINNNFSDNAVTSLYNDTVFPEDKSSLLSLKTSPVSVPAKHSSHDGSPVLKSPDEYLPSPSDLSYSDTFQDLSIFMPQGSTVSATGPSFTTSSYSKCASFSENSSNSQFTTCSYSNETISVTEQERTEFKRSFASISDDFSIACSSNKITKCAEVKIKHSRHQDIRKKNNVASQRSRMTRKEREREMESKAVLLEQENETLRVKVRKLEELAQELKNHLLTAFLKK